MAAIARWESRGGVHYVELSRSLAGYGYTGRKCGGCLGAIGSDEAAIAVMQARVDSGYFLLDSAKMPMERVGPIASSVRIKKGPTLYTCSGAWEVIVHLPICSDKSVATAWHKLPEYVDFDGRIYRKQGFRSSDCIAWYRAEAH